MSNKDEYIVEFMCLDDINSEKEQISSFFF